MKRIIASLELSNNLLIRDNSSKMFKRFPSIATRTIKISFPFILFLSALLPRAIYPLARSTIWRFRAIEFIQAISEKNWVGTLQAPHPGVTTMWLSGIAYRLGSALIPDYSQQLLHKQMAFELLPVVVVISLAILMAYFLLSRIFDRQVAGVAGLLLALDPLHIAVSQTLHVDALMSAFAMISALWMLVFAAQTQRNRLHYVSFSGIFAGLALLSKTPSFFLLPYLFLCLGAWTLSDSPLSWCGLRLILSRWRDWRRPIIEVLRIFILWSLAFAITYFLLWPAMWSQPAIAFKQTFGGTEKYTVTPHENPVLFMGQTTLTDPGVLFYPATLSLKATEITLPLFFVGLLFLLSRKLDRQKRRALLLAGAFVLFFTAQMTLGQKKATRYNLPAHQFLDIVAAVGIVYTLRWLARDRRWLLNLGLFLIVAAQFAVSIGRHPYYGTHYNRLFGSPKTVLEGGIVAGQEQGEGLDLAAGYLNGLPMSRLLVVGAQVDEFFLQYFQGKTVPMTDDKVDYLVFARNWVVRGMEEGKWRKLWEAYQVRRPKLVITFDDVPYVWVYKVNPVIDETTYSRSVHADVGQDFRLLGYDLEPAQARPGETVRLALYWEAVQKPIGDLTVFAHLLGPNGQIRGQQDNQPQRGMYPTYLWDEGEQIQDEYELTIASDAPAGNYQIAVGMYYLATLERLPIRDRNGSLQPDDRLLIPGPQVLPPSE